MTAARPSQASVAYWHDRALAAEKELVEARAKAALHQRRCYRAWDEENRSWVHIPMCCGGAIGGPDQCTCDYPGSPHDALVQERDDLRREVEVLRHMKSDLWRRLVRAQEHIRRMQREAMEARRRADPGSVVTIRPRVSDE